MYDRTIPAFRRILTALSANLEKAAAHCTEHGIDPAVLFSARLYPDMWALDQQVRAACEHACKCAARLTGADPLDLPATETDLAGLRDRIAATLDHLDTYAPESLSVPADQPVTIPLGKGPVTFTALDYVNHFILPNFYFHATTAYAILRHNGVRLGKLDFVGR